MTLTWDITYNDKRCGRCGRYWSVESAKCDKSTCPCCAYDAIRKTDSEVSRRDATITNLRGQITKLKNKLK